MVSGVSLAFLLKCHLKEWQLGQQHHLATALKRLQGAAEGVLAQFLEPGPSETSVEVRTLVEGIDFDWGLGGGGVCVLGTLTGRAETADSTGVGGDC